MFTGRVRPSDAPLRRRPTRRALRAPAVVAQTVRDASRFGCGRHPRRHRTPGPLQTAPQVGASRTGDLGATQLSPVNSRTRRPRSSGRARPAGEGPTTVTEAEHNATPDAVEETPESIAAQVAADEARVTFEQLDLDPRLLRAVRDAGYDYTTLFRSHSRDGKRRGLSGRPPRARGVLVAWDAGEVARQRDARPVNIPLRRERLFELKRTQPIRRAVRRLRNASADSGGRIG